MFGSQSFVVLRMASLNFSIPAWKVLPLTFTSGRSTSFISKSDPNFCQ